MSVSSQYRYDPDRFKRVFEHEFGYLAGVARNSRRFASRPALHDPASGRRWTYAQLWEDTGRLAAGLSERGVQAEDVVVLDLLNGPEFALAWIAVQRLGAIATPINFRLAPGEVAHVLDDSRPAVLILDASLATVAAEALERARHQPALLVTADHDDWQRSAGSMTPFGELFAAASTPPPPAPAPARGIYAETTRLYTSGTTGLPKGVSLPDIVEVLSAHDVIMHFPLTPEDRTLNMTPWFHRGGLYSGGPNPVFYVGAEAVPLRAFDAATVLDWVAEHRLTFLIGAPTNLALLSAEQQARPRDLSSLHGIVTMGAPLDREACLRYQRLLTPRIFNGYGTTEAFWNTFLRPADLPEHAGSAGRACTDDDVAVVRVYEDRVAAAHELAAQDGQEVGEVIVRSVKSGYAYVNNAPEQAARFRDGWLYIGDLATWDADGYVTIVGRKDDMIISGGENVHPTQVEAALNEHPGVRDSIVVGIPDERWGELVVAYIVPEGGVAPDVAELERHVREHPMLAHYKRPRAYRFIEQIPLTATGKKLHYRVREQARGDAAAGLLERPCSSADAQAADPVITGIGAVTPLGNDAPTSWRRLVAGESGVGLITQFDPAGLPTRIAGEVKDFDPEALLGTKRARRSARFSQLAVMAAREAFADAGLEPGAGIESVADHERVGVVLNTAVTGIPETEANVAGLLADGVRGVSPYYVPEMIANMPACEVAIDLRLHGPVTASALACASGNAALLEARRLILADEADVVIAGGTDAGITRVMFAGLSNMGALSANNEDPAGACRPFAADRDGFVYGEGAVLLVVESAAHAHARGARAYGSVAGGALTTDAFHISHPDPTGRQPRRALRLALERTGTVPDEVDYICAHGTATRINDAVETAVIRGVFGDAADALLISSPKSMVGHLIGAAGALSAMVALLAMRDGIVPPTINLEHPDPACDLDYVPLQARAASVRTALVNAFGFGGQNCVVVLRAPD